MLSVLSRQLIAGVRALLILTLITGVVYPLGVWAFSRTPGLRHHAEGSVVTVDGVPAGSSLIGIDPVGDQWFHARPSATAADPLGPADAAVSGASNRAADSAVLVETIMIRRRAIAAREGGPVDQVPTDAVTASASGLDPHISPVYADLQIARVARVNRLSVERVRALVHDHTDGRDLGFVGEPRVNVGDLNRALARTRP